MNQIQNVAYIVTKPRVKFNKGPGGLMFGCFGGSPVLGCFGARVLQGSPGLFGDREHRAGVPEAPDPSGWLRGSGCSGPVAGWPQPVPGGFCPGGWVAPAGGWAGGPTTEFEVEFARGYSIKSSKFKRTGLANSFLNFSREIQK